MPLQVRKQCFHPWVRLMELTKSFCMLCLLNLYSRLLLKAFTRPDL